jgi:CubicO group peptidase (beta-lactamase class C family)
VSGIAAGSTRFAAADEVIREALGVRCTAVVLRVEHGGRSIFERAYGALDESAASPSTTVTTRFDLASLTKVVVATAALRAVAEGSLRLDAPLAGAVPEWRDRAQGAITLRMLLAHTSGMQSGADYRQLLGSDVELYALLRPLVAAPGERVVYSDLGFIALGTVLARARGASLGTAVRDASVAARAYDIAYRPLAAERDAIPATEDDGWRGRLRGVVHDEKAYLMNGCAGHAGLFGTARDVARFVEPYLAPLHGRGGGVLPTSIARSAIAEAAFDPVLRRGLGWALKTSESGSCGRRMDRSTFGHTGFTGTSVWADPARDLSIVLLTNAVYYGRTDIRELRAAVSDAVVEAFDG